MSFGAGKDAVIKLDNQAASLTDITAYATSVAFTQNHNVIDVTVLGKNWREKIGGISDATLSVEGIFDPAFGTVLHHLTGGTVSASTSFEYHPQGTAAGKPKITGEVFIESYDAPSNLDEAVTFTFSGQTSGTVSWGVN